MKLIVLVCKKYLSSTIPQYLRPCTVVWGYHSELETGFWYIWSSLSSDSKHIFIWLYIQRFSQSCDRKEKCKMWQQRGKYGSELHHETQEDFSESPSCLKSSEEWRAEASMEGRWDCGPFLGWCVAWPGRAGPTRLYRPESGWSCRTDRGWMVPSLTGCGEKCEFHSEYSGNPQQSIRGGLVGNI